MLCDKCSGHIRDDSTVSSSTKDMTTEFERPVVELVRIVQEYNARRAALNAAYDEDSKPKVSVVIKIIMHVGRMEIPWRLIKLNSDTPFKGVLERFHQDHPHKQLYFHETTRFVLETDTPDSLGLEHGAKLHFYQEGNEPTLMLGMTAN